MSVCLSVCIVLSLSASLSLPLSLAASLRLPVCISVSLSLSLSLSLSVCLSLSLSLSESLRKGPGGAVQYTQRFVNHKKIKGFCVIVFLSETIHFFISLSRFWNFYLTQGCFGYDRISWTLSDCLVRKWTTSSSRYSIYYLTQINLNPFL